MGRNVQWVDGAGQEKTLSESPLFQNTLALCTWTLAVVLLTTAAADDTYYSDTR